jgi:hypothetical protein
MEAAFFSERTNPMAGFPRARWRSLIRFFFFIFLLWVLGSFFSVFSHYPAHTSKFLILFFPLPISPRTTPTFEPPRNTQGKATEVGRRKKSL